MRLSPYPRYKAGPAKWLGDIPEHWAFERVKYSLSEKRARAAPALPAGAISFGQVVQKDGERLPEETLATYQEVLAGEYLINPINLNYDLISLRTALSSVDVVVSPAYIVARPDPAKLLPAFGRYLLYVFDIRHMKSLGAGVRQTIGFKDIGNCYWALPTMAEQEAISSFLDRETNRIDSLIEKKGRFINLLREKRHAMVTKVIMTGLNADCLMKDSRSKWLRSVPAHWVVAPVKHFFDCLDGRRIPLSSEERGKMQGQYPYYGASGIIDHVDRPLFREDLVLVSEDGANLTYRTYPIAFVARGEYWVNNHAHILRPHDGLVDFWAERLEAIDLIPYITGSTQPKLTIENLMNIRVSAPPSVDERREIALHIRAVTAGLDDLITKTQRSIELLKEHRSALITAAVTGKIDVRGLAAKNMRAAA